MPGINYSSIQTTQTSTTTAADAPESKTLWTASFEPCADNDDDKAPEKED